MTPIGWNNPPGMVVRAVVLVTALAIAAPSNGAPAVDPFLVADEAASPAPAVRLTSGYAPVVGEVVVDAATGQPLFAEPAFAPVPYEAGGVMTPTGAPAIELGAYESTGWNLEVLPDGIIYRSYLAGPREPRLGTQLFHNETASPRSELLWDGTVGGRRGLFRYGNSNPADPEGWQLDLEGAAIVRLNLDENRDVDASDFRFGVPLTYGEGDTQYKFGYYHLSSHLGDELITRTGVNSRINYVRDAIIFGVSHELTPAVRVYGETAYAFFTAGGAEPWEFQFGVEYAQPGPTGPHGTPFVATNAHLREEVDFGGDWNFQTGWLWRGATGSTFRVGMQYMNGKSTQYQFFNRNEEQIGVGFWYDF
jgi:hypothetical protein